MSDSDSILHEVKSVTQYAVHTPLGAVIYPVGQFPKIQSSQQA
jgi:hypothetical protein